VRIASSARINFRPPAARGFRLGRAWNPIATRESSPIFEANFGERITFHAPVAIFRYTVFRSSGDDGRFASGFSDIGLMSVQPFGELLGIFAVLHGVSTAECRRSISVDRSIRAARSVCLFFANKVQQRFVCLRRSGVCLERHGEGLFGLA